MLQSIINFLTVTPSDALIYLLMLGLVFGVIGWVNEVVAVIRRFRYLTSESTRGLFTWQTAVWMPVRLLVIIILPQVVFQLFINVLKFG